MVYYNQEARLAELKNSITDGQIKELKEVVKELKSVVDQHSKKIQDVLVSLEKSYLRYNAQADSVKALANEFKEFTREIRDDMKQMNSTVISLGNDMAIVKTRKPRT